MSEEITITKEKLTSPWQLLVSATLMYRERLKVYWQMYLYALAGIAPLVIILAIFEIINLAKFPLAQEAITKMTLGLLGLCSVIFMLYFSLRTKVGLILICREDPQTSVKVVFAKTNKYFIPYLVVSIIVGILIALWSVLLIIPGIAFALSSAFAVFIVIFEDQKPWQAIKQSKELVKGYWWAVFGRFAYAGLALIILNILLGILNYFLPANSFASYTWSAITQLIIAVFTPILFFYSYLLYKNISAIKKH